MLGENFELLRLQALALDARQRLDRLEDVFQDEEVLRHARDIWLEADEVASTYENGLNPGRLQRRT